MQSHNPRWRGRLLGQLVRRRGEFLAQGEVYATIGLGVVLGQPAASAAFAALVGASSDLTWQSEIDVAIPGGGIGRLDLVGHRSVGAQTKPVCVIEAKIHQPLDEHQLRQYAAWQQDQFSGAAPTDPDLGDAVLAVLVPETRMRDAERVVVDLRRTVAVRVTVVSWEQVFEALAGAELGVSFDGDLDQLMALYHEYNALWVEPFARSETVAAGWEDRRGDYRRLADQITMQLREEVVAVNGVARGRGLLPMQPQGHRYVRLAPPPNDSHLAVGLFSALEGGVPFAVRFRPNDSSHFAELVAGLQASALEVEHGPDGEVFVRLDVPAHSTQPHMIATLRRQLVEVVRAALPDIGTRLAG